MEELLFASGKRPQIDKFLLGNIKEEQREAVEKLIKLHLSDPININSKSIELLTDIFKGEENSIKATHLSFDRFNKKAEDSMRFFSKSSLSILTIEDASELEVENSHALNSFNGLTKISLTNLSKFILKEQLEHFTVLQRIEELELINCKSLKKYQKN